ncbi:Histone-lysine N-methyltransferase ASHR1 [Smittium culicis]|uniref:Histone-lysine N-methyltransferase ASHR1 n=1 Tax=Smittium culicis TaxID=133412 RepID=A0A1R1XU98_9FUNG|nr:Histone-lysine N-methyltransferase ASHR1 [Smittium culicis]
MTIERIPAKSTPNKNMDSIAKTKKKAKKQVKPCQFTDAESIYPVEFKITLSKGKHIVSSTDIKAGTEILVEKAPIHIVRGNTSSSICHLCLAPAPVNEVDQQQRDKDGKVVKDAYVKVKIPKHRCTECNFTVYCSPECMHNDSETHKMECSAIKNLIEISPTVKFDFDKVRTVLKSIVKSTLNNSPDQKFIAGAKVETPLRFVDEIPSHRESFEKEWLDSTSEELKNIKLPEPFKNNSKTLSEMLTQACRYQTNAIPFHDSIYRGVYDAYGIFPMISSYIKHSCSPNAVIIGSSGPTVSVRSLVDIPKGTEITISMTELYQPREHRRRDLLLNKHFWCKCRRCSTVLSKSVDQYMDGIVCSKCHLGLMIFEETKEVDDVNELMKNTSLLDEEIMGKFASCNSCSNKLPVVDLVDILRSAIEAFSAAFQQYRQRNTETARKLFEAYLVKFENNNLLHPYNSYIVNSLIPLMHCCRAMKDTSSAIKYCQKAIDQMTRSEAFPPNYPDITELRITLGELLLEQASQKISQSSIRSTSVRNQAKKLYAEANECFKQALAERTISAGRSHPRYEQLISYIKFCNTAPADIDSRKQAAVESSSAKKTEAAPATDAAEDPSNPSSKKEKKSKKEKNAEKEKEQEKKAPKSFRKQPKKLPPSLISSIQMNMSK